MSKLILLDIFLFLMLGLLQGTGSASAAVANHLVINEVQIEGAAGSGGVEDDWVELYNPTASIIDLTGWSIQKAAASGGSITRQALSGSIPAQGFYLIVRNGASTSVSLKVSADFLAGETFSLASNNIIYLADNNLNVVPALIDEHVIDFVGFGTASYFEMGAAPAITKGSSIARVPDGEDTDNNAVDFTLQAIPTPQSSSSQPPNNIGGTVLLTIAPDITPVQNITPNGADIVFQLNTAGNAKVNYGLTGAYGSSTVSQATAENITKEVGLAGLICNTTYHYSIYAENSAITETDVTADASFVTLPCGISLNSLIMTKQTAKANNIYNEGWEWAFDLTIWNLAESSLKMKFDSWVGTGSLNAGGNMQFSVDNRANWFEITENSAYPVLGADISGLDSDTSPGRQVSVIVRMKVPQATLAGAYTSSYGILTE